MLSALLPIPETEELINVISVKENQEGYFVFVTREGQVMRTPVQEILHARTPEAMTLKEDDALVKVFVSTGENDLFLVTLRGQAIRFAEAEVNPMGRKSRGVRGMALDEGDEVIDAALITSAHRDILSVTERGWLKRTALEHYKPQGRGGKGIALAKLNPDKTGLLVGALVLAEDSSLVLIQKSGRATTVAISKLEREARVKPGSPLVDVMLDDYVVRVLI